MRNDAPIRLGLGGLLLGIYLGLQPIYWIPSLPASGIAVVKVLFLISGATALVLPMIGRNAFRIPKGMVGPSGLLVLLVLSVSGVVQAAPLDQLRWILMLFLGFSVAWLGYNLTRSGRRFSQLLTVGFVFTLPFVILTLIDWRTGLPGWINPIAETALPLWAGGFGSSRTGWATSLAYVIPLPVLWMARDRLLQGRGAALIGGLGFALVVASQYAAGGRSGLVAAVVATASVLWLLRTLPVLPVAVAAGLLVWSAGTSEDAAQQLRLTRLVGQELTASSIDAFSAGRLGQAVVAIEMTADRPLLGHGLRAGRGEIGRQTGEEFDIHNSWLKWAAELGIGFPLVFTFGVMLWTIPLVRVTRAAGKGNPLRSEGALAVSVVLTGLTCGLFEPNVLLGNMHVGVPWWLAIGVGLGVLRESRTTAPVENRQTEPEWERVVQ
jgi:hypothetical protein